MAIVFVVVFSLWFVPFCFPLWRTNKTYPDWLYTNDNNHMYIHVIYR